MRQTDYTDYTDSQLEALRDNLARSHSKAILRVGFLAFAFLLASLLGFRVVPAQVFFSAPPIFLLVALLMLAPTFRMNVQRDDVIRELESRGVSAGTVISPMTSKPDTGASSAANTDLQRAVMRRLRLPGIGAALSILATLSLTAALIISDAPDGSWIFTAIFVLFAVTGVFFVWCVSVVVSASRLRR